MKLATYVLVVEGDCERGYSAYYPDVPGCVTAGESIDETLRLASEALDFHLEDEPVPPAARRLAEILADPEEAGDFDGSELFAAVAYRARHAESVAAV